MFFPRLSDVNTENAEAFIYTAAAFIQSEAGCRPCLQLQGSTVAFKLTSSWSVVQLVHN